MNLSSMVAGALLFAMAAFLFPTLVTAIDAVSIAEPLQPILASVPYLLVGSIFIAIFVLIYRGND